MAQSNCAIDPHDTSCGLDTTLHLLYWLATALAIFLIAIIVVAVIAYRKTKNAKLTPHD